MTEEDSPAGVLKLRAYIPQGAIVADLKYTTRVEAWFFWSERHWSVWFANSEIRKMAFERVHPLTLLAEQARQAE